MAYINLNGKIIPASEAAMPVDNGAFRYGYGLFETMMVRDGVIRLGQYHWERLMTGLKQLYFEVPPLMTAAWLEQVVLATVKKNKLEKLCRVRLQMFAAGGGLYGLESKQPGFVIECFPLEPSILQLNENGLTVGIAADLGKSMDSLANLKSANALIYAMGARQAKANKWNDALICNTDGHIIESTIANIFWLSNGVLHTPPLADGCVAGVMRRHLLAKMPVMEKSLTIDELLQADEVLLTNAVNTLKWMGAIGDKKYGHEQAKKIHHLLGM